MKIDAFFPPAPQYNQPPLKCSDLTPGRQRALSRLAAIAAYAESLVGSLKIEHPASSIQFPATSRGFALHCIQASPYAAEVAELLGRSKLIITGPDHVDAPHVMLIDVRRYWGTLGPLAGDIVLFADGQAAVVTRPLCMGCQHFEGISLDVEGPPQIVKKVHWASTLKWIIRLVDEEPETAAPAEASAPERGGINGEAVLESFLEKFGPATSAGPQPSTEAAPAAEDPASTPQKKKRTGIA